MPSSILVQRFLYRPYKIHLLPLLSLSLSLSPCSVIIIIKLSRKKEKEGKKEMGLSSRLRDVSSDSIPILLVVTAAEWVSYLRSLLFCLLRSLGLLRLHPAAATTADDPLFSAAGSGLAGLVVIASSTCSFAYEAPPPSAAGAVDEEEEKEEARPECVVCLCGLADGDRVRRLACCHVFHSECLDGWFDQRNLSCPLCRSPLAPEERRADADRRIGVELVAWLSPY